DDRINWLGCRPEQRFHPQCCHANAHECRLVLKPQRAEAIRDRAKDIKAKLAPPQTGRKQVLEGRLSACGAAEHELLTEQVPIFGGESQFVIPT
ncbi:hypothetical protein ACOI1H_21660, partial [Loktanella sp. DJP18]|uniref:hypothetical protein n=1 Tax=Loktanella sp. DJP18 TaxID=3409788 RepID=UPI003BB6C939